MATHIPLKGEALPGHADKLVHFTMYAGLSFLLSAWFAAGGKSGFGFVVLAFVITAVYCAVDELLQTVVDRNPDFYDWLADCAGSLVGLSAMRLFRRICFRKPADGES